MHAFRIPRMAHGDSCDTSEASAFVQKICVRKSSLLSEAFGFGLGWSEVAA